MAEIRPHQYQNGDMNRGIEIDWNVKPYITKGYVAEDILCNSLFKTFAVF